MKPRVAVVGRGVAGLSTALELAKQGVQVDVVSAAHGPAIASWNAGAFWHPYKVDRGAEIVDWAVATYQALANLVDLSGTGVRKRYIDVYLHKGTERPTWSSQVESFRELCESELPDGFHYGFQYKTFAVAMPKFLTWLERMCLDRGVVFSATSLGSLRELNHELVVNCSGLGAMDLVPDREMSGVEGTVAIFDGKSKCDKILFCPDVTPHPRYFIPHDKYYAVGGSCVSSNDEAIAVSEILKHARSTFVNCIGKSYTEIRTGVRPMRPSVRLESDLSYENKVVVHNYGHGGAGVTLSTGCAQAACKILMNYISLV